MPLSLHKLSLYKLSFNGNFTQVSVPLFIIMIYIIIYVINLHLPLYKFPYLFTPRTQAALSALFPRDYLFSIYYNDLYLLL